MSLDFPDDFALILHLHLNLIERRKKGFDIQTYREIIAFIEGKRLDEIAKAREEGKRPYQKVLLAFGAGVVTLVLSLIFMYLLK
ncbi:hypothetical protein [Acetivibrio sp.]|uniref:hypothetical protein n=1 Tax=Acetivibrio sp. TaxID=1872092 RepID=UPI002D1FAAD3|nr:hypothetical protein [Acetivibrio sp.]